ncbi:acetyl-CoA carboxylase biotin carboxyl carrier protein [Lachnospiraceae bacterium NSJ-143]|nr:acetyl-CoA carboxylase biotin carboxyl carrier protein [Lachnospiraceae bacterium NSJ-143]
MNFNEVKELISMVDSSGFKNFELTLDNCNVKMNKTGASFAAPSNEVSPAAVQTAQVSQAAPAAVQAQTDNEVKPAPAVDKAGNIVKAPLVGTFYESAGPGKPVYAPVGAKVKKGDVLCIIEAMKIMNEVVSEFDGEVKEVLVDNEQLVEYGQPLFVVG